MFRKGAILLSIMLLAFVTACGSHKSANATSASGGSGAGAPVSSSASPCPTKNTKAFPKTRFVADAAIAGGVFKHWIYTPMKEGKFQKGTHGRIFSFVKAAAAGGVAINRLFAAKNAAEQSPLLCKFTIGPITKLSSSIKNLVSGAKHDSINPAQVMGANSALSLFHAGSAKAGDGFTDNQNASLSG